MSAKKEKRLRRAVTKVVKKTGTEVVKKFKARLAYVSVALLVSALLNIAFIYLLLRGHS